MKIRIKLLLMKEIERRNTQRVKAFTEHRKRPLRERHKNPIGIWRSPGKSPDGRCNDL